jgi:serine/threonine-protein phosphatase 6 regulatory subunit 3
MPQCYAQQMIVRNEGMGSENITSLDTERLAKGVRQVQAAIVPRLQDFTYLLLNPPHREPIRTTVGIIDKPLGATRLEVAHLFTALLSTNNLEIVEKLSELETLTILIVSVFVRFNIFWCN